MSMSSKGESHSAACLLNGLHLSNNVCEYEVNQLTYEKVIRGKQNFNANCLRRRTNPDGPPGWNFTNL